MKTFLIGLSMMLKPLKIKLLVYRTFLLIKKRRLSSKLSRTHVSFLSKSFFFRKPFINREITNYRARHQKCNFRIFYNKHMLDMDDLATLDGQNWLNDQVSILWVLGVEKLQRMLDHKI